MPELRLQGLKTRNLLPINLRIAPGELVFLSGPSGSGKSLLLRALADLDEHQGEVWLDATPCAALPAPEWRRRVGLLPAEALWWHDRVGDHFPARHDPHLLDRLGFGPEVLDWQVARLSTGERQRLALARLLALQPQALLLDEATANLDPPNRDRVEALIQDYRRERAAPVLWVSHDPDQRQRLAQPAPDLSGARRLIIHGDRLVAEGPAEGIGGSSPPVARANQSASGSGSGSGSRTESDPGTHHGIQAQPQQDWPPSDKAGSWN